jgi:hypothetical protein
VKKLDAYTVAVERGASNAALAWCLELQGCCALVRAGEDPVVRAETAIAEFIAWSHERNAERATVDKGSVTLVQTLDTEADVLAGESIAFFSHDLEPSNPREFPRWANAHDQALDELRELAMSLPPLLWDQADENGRRLGDIVNHAARTEVFFAAQLKPGGGPTLQPGPRSLNDAHAWLQQVVCDVDPRPRFRREHISGQGTEDWSVRKVMRRSIWHLRYHTTELNRGIGRIWLP